MGVMKHTERVVENEDLQTVITIAKQRGYKVFTHESSSKTIEQIYIENKDGRIGSCSTYYGGIKFFTMHKVERGSGLGDGFGKLVEGQDFNSPQDLDVCFKTYPYWSIGVSKSVEKYKSFQEYQQQKKTNYFEF